MNSVDLLPHVREIYSRLPDTFHLVAWEMQSLLFSLGYTDELEDEGEITAAIEVARDDWPQRRARRAA